MGCDIHCYIEYKVKRAHDGQEFWSSHGGRINPGRNYWAFGHMASVRSDRGLAFPPKGYPEDADYYANQDAYLYIDDECSDEDGYTSLARAKQWEKHGHKIIERDGKPYKVEHPDWHSHSWLTPDEFEQVCKQDYKDACNESGKIDGTYTAILATLRALEKEYEGARLVFWFDN
jgi:hypothetical protein